VKLPVFEQPHNPNSSFMHVRVSPGASRSQWLGLMGNQFVKIALQAPATDGKANAALCKFIAKEFQIKAKGVEIIKGEKSQNKTVLIAIDKSKLTELLIPLLATK